MERTPIVPKSCSGSQTSSKLGSMQPWNQEQVFGYGNTVLGCYMIRLRDLVSWTDPQIQQAFMLADSNRSDPLTGTCTRPTKRHNTRSDKAIRIVSQGKSTRKIKSTLFCHVDGFVATRLLSQCFWRSSWAANKAL